MRQVFINFHYVHLIDEDAEVLRDEMTGLGLLGQEEGDSGFELRFLLGIV